MAIEIAKPDTHRRAYSLVELDNGVKVVIGSDPECDKAGAALCVNVGMCHERKDLPGLAHFLEHMLFTGTDKYPKEGEYHEFMQQNGGFANAYTTCYFTSYMFEVKPEVLPEALDRFSRFFYEPLLTRDCTDREINAVDSEFQGGYTQPWWRYIGIMNMSANPEHPFHVAVGNNKVLRDEPKERGIDLYEEMKKLYHSCYSANGMTVCVIGKESTAELEALVRTAFAGIVNKGVTMPIGDSVSDKPPFLPRDWNRLLLQNPVKDVKELVFSWVIPFQGPLWRTKPTAYVSHLLGYEGAGSVVSVLKQKGLISSCYCGDGAWLEGAFSLLNVTFDLTDKGLSHLEEIGSHLFAFIGMLQKTPVERWIFDEMCKLRKIQFKFGEDKRPFHLCSDIALSLLLHPPSEALAADVLLYEYDPESIRDILVRLTLDSVRVTHQAKCLADRCTERDTSYDSPMAFLPLEPAWLASWSAAAGPGDKSPEAAVQAAAALGLHLPKPNPFIPEDLSLRDLPAEPPQMPMPLAGAEPPVACLFHRQDDVFRQPKATVAFHIHSGFIAQDARSFTQVELWCRAVEEALSEYAYDAQVAGVHYRLGIRQGTLTLTVDGFNDKLGVLLEAVTEKMRAMEEVPENIFGIVADAYSDDIKNQAFHSAPYKQCSMRFSELTSRGLVFPAHSCWEAFQGLSREDLGGMPGRLFGPGSHVEVLALGNLAPDNARALAQTLLRGLRLDAPLATLPERAEAALPEGATLWSLDSADADDPNHAVVLRLQLPQSVEAEMMLRLVDKVLSAKFFECLRTQQQLGYIVQLYPGSTAAFVYLIAVIQSEFPPDYVRGRIDAFLQESSQAMSMLSEEEFETCRAGLLAELRMKPKNLAEEMARFQRYVLDRTYDFGRRQQCIDFLESAASLASFRAFCADRVFSAPRLWTQVRKVLTKEDKPLPQGGSVPSDPESLRKWEGHKEVVAAFGQSATWVPLNASPRACPAHSAL